MKKVKSISELGIEYLDDENNTIGFIDFKVCHENWIKYRSREDDLSEERIAEIKEMDKNVGKRNSSCNPRYITFFTLPDPIKFEFSDLKEYEKLRDKIWLLGWTTLDLS